MTEIKFSVESAMLHPANNSRESVGCGQEMKKQSVGGGGGRHWPMFVERDANPFKGDVSLIRQVQISCSLHNWAQWTWSRFIYKNFPPESKRRTEAARCGAPRCPLGACLCRSRDSLWCSSGALGRWFRSTSQLLLWWHYRPITETKANVTILQEFFFLLLFFFAFYIIYFTHIQASHW